MAARLNIPAHPRLIRVGPSVLGALLHPVAGPVGAWGVPAGKRGAPPTGRRSVPLVPPVSPGGLKPGLLFCPSRLEVAVRLAPRLCVAARGGEPC